MAIALYNIILHPLAKFPGPELHGAFYFPLSWHNYTGNLATVTKSLYESGKRHKTADNFTHAFSPRVLSAQESLTHSYGNLLITRRAKIDIAAWLNFTTFDLFGDLTFGEPFHALESGTYHPWMAAILTMRSEIVNEGGYVLKYNDAQGMNTGEIVSSARVIIAAGNEITATALSGLNLCLLQTDHALEILTKEIRGGFKRVEEMTLKEGEEGCPAVAMQLSRLTPKEGCIINNHFIPGNVCSISISISISNP
ncbi:hypothetical protein F5882DRAFT_428910 [Hyaloscypha sp. PMI_1271]|nr:hypothetical protein F5882DRAFT_428910 [Hyaloscypha sp. PMI_1271]